MMIWLIKISLDASSQHGNSRNPMLHGQMVTELIYALRHTGNRHEVMISGFLEKLVKNLNAIIGLLARAYDAEDFSGKQRNISDIRNLFDFGFDELEFEMKILLSGDDGMDIEAHGCR